MHILFSVTTWPTINIYYINSITFKLLLKIEPSLSLLTLPLSMNLIAHKLQTSFWSQSLCLSLAENYDTMY